MAQSNWEADKMLDTYIYDHLVKKKLHNIAKSFVTEGKVSPDPVAIDAPGGFLFEWWSVFWEMFYARTKEKHDESVVEYGLNVYIFDYLVKKKLHYTAKLFMTEVKVSPDNVAIDDPRGFLSEWWSLFWDVYIAKTNEKHYESTAEAQQGKPKEQMKQPNPINTETSQTHMDAGTIHHGQMVQGNNQGGVSAALQSRTQQTPLINMPPVQHSSSQQQDPLLSQQSQQNNSTGSGNMVGSSNSQLSTPSTHTPVDGDAMTGNMPKGPMMYGSDTIGGLASSANQLWQQGKAEEEQIQMKQLNPVNTETSGTNNHGEMVQRNDQGGDVSAAILKQLKSQTQQTPVITLLDRIFFSVLVTFLHCTKHMGLKLEAGEGESRKRCKCKKSKCLQLLDVYIYDYLVKKKLHNTAKSFMTEGKVSPDPVAIDAPGGFLFEWWSVFWDIFIARTNEKHSESAAAYIEAQQGKAKEQQMQLQQLQMMRQAQMRRDPSLGGPMNAIVSDGMVGQSNNASAMAAKMYEERMKQPNPMNAETSQPHMDPRMALLKSGTSHHGQMVQGNHQGGVSAALQQLQSRTQQTPEIKSEVNLGASPRQLPVDPSTVYGQGILQSKPGMGSAGLNPGVGVLPLKGWPLTGIDNMRQGLGPQVQKAFLQNQGQFQLSPQQQQQQQIMAQVQGQGNMTNSSVYGDMDTRRFSGLPRGNLNSKDGQQNANDGSIGSPMLSNSSKLINMPQVQQSSSQQQDPLLSQQNNRKRKGPSSSGPANSTGTGNTVGPSNSQPSTPSTHTPVEGVAMTGNMQHVNNMPKGPMMYGSDAIGGLASSANQLDDMEPFGDVGALEDNVESFLSQDDGDGGSLFGTLKRNPSEHTETSKVFSFNEVGSIRRSASKVICCNFSSDGKLLASAGHDKKVFIWNMETLHTEIPPEEHGHIITDVRFQPNSTQLATSSFDKTIKIWDVSKPGYFVRTISGHNAPVMSLDFHPKKTDLFCSCDTNNEIRFWSINAANCLRAQGASTQVRYQPKLGQMLAAASENIVSIFDVEQYRGVHSFKGHSSSVHSICWNPTGELVASLSEDSVKVWSAGSGECIHELSSSGNKFHSCVYHPTYPNLLVIGGYQSLELWDTGENKCMTIAAHECVISALAQSSSTGMMASASHDKSVKIWK
uniref:LisH domain-containing protein n=1 Tax=Brassica campestris TaxID=3711 RepID=M4E296_BRACM